MQACTVVVLCCVYYSYTNNNIETLNAYFWGCLYSFHAKMQGLKMNDQCYKMQSAMEFFTF